MSEIIINGIFTAVLNLLPIVALAIPYFFIRKKLVGKLYFRILLGIVVFYLIYWVFPLVFQFDTLPKEMTGGDVGLGIGYIFAHFGSLISQFLNYPLVTLPFIFFVAPFISLILVWNRLRKESGTRKENLQFLTYEFTESPYDIMKRELMSKDWTREKEILKLLIVLLPISLYLLQVILTVTGLETVDIANNETALGWFIEILFVYLATFIFSIELLYSSRLALKGRYFGENIRSQTYKSLYTVGAPISILSILLFIVQFYESIPIMLYFFGYFIMASIIFILFLKIFEPISIFILIKIIHWQKKRKQKATIMPFKNILYILTFGVLVVVIYVLLNIFVFTPIFISLFGDASQAEIIIDSGRFDQNPTLFQAFSFDLMLIFNFITLILIPLLLTTIPLAYGLKKMKSSFNGITVYLVILVGFSILFTVLNLTGYFTVNTLINFAPDKFWITGQTSYTRAFTIPFFTLRTAGFDANLTGLLGYIAIPFLYTRYIFNIVIWGLIILYLGRSFVTKSIKIDDKYLEKTIFAPLEDFLSSDEYLKEKNQYLITREKSLTDSDIEQKRDEVKELLNSLKSDQILDELVPVEKKEKERFYYTLKKLYRDNLIDIHRAEFSYSFERVEKQGLYIIYDDGRGVFDYNFVKEYNQDPGLVSGMFSAITSFIKETTRSEDLLKTIDHGDITILLEYGRRIFGALFIKGKQSSEVRAYLKEFVNQFEAKYQDILADWSGALIHFKEDHKLVEEIFKED